MVTAERCKLTELLVDACACPKHRGGQAPDEEAAAEQLRARARLLAEPFGPWWPAAYAGNCTGCRSPYAPGTAIRRVTTDNPNTTRTYLAECCEEEHR